MAAERAHGLLPLRAHKAPHIQLRTTQSPSCTPRPSTQPPPGPLHPVSPVPHTALHSPLPTMAAAARERERSRRVSRGLTAPYTRFRSDDARTHGSNSSRSREKSGPRTLGRARGPEESHRGKMTVCAMFGCKNRMHKGCGKHFFRFPLKDPERLAKWIDVVQRDDWKPSVHSKVCSDHFTEKDYMIRPGAACPYLRTDAVPTPLFIQRKKKTKKRKYTKKSAAGVAPVSYVVLDDMQVEKAESQTQEHQAEDMVKQHAAPPSRAAQEPPKHDPEPQNQEEAVKTQDKELAEMDSMLWAQTQGGEQSAQTQSQGQVETWGHTTAEEPGRQAVETRQPPSARMAEIDVNATTQSERQVALILAELEDTHCEMRAAWARAAREAANNAKQPPGDEAADCAASGVNQPCSDITADYIPFDHAYTALTMSDKENNIPPLSPAPVSTPVPVSSPIPANPKVVKLRKKIKTLQKQVLRQGVKIKSLKNTLGELRRSNLSERDPERVVSEHCSGLALTLFTTQVKNHRKYSAVQYCNPMKDFAMSLYQASPKAYKFCRLFLSLPHPVSLRHWKTATEANQEALQEVIMQAEAEQGEDLQGEFSQEDILAGALHAVAIASEGAQDGALQDEAPPGAQMQ